MFCLHPLFLFEVRFQVLWFSGSVAASDLRCSIGFFLCSSVVVGLFSSSTSLAIETEPEPSHWVFGGNGNFPCVRNRPISFFNLVPSSINHVVLLPLHQIQTHFAP